MCLTTSCLLILSNYSEAGWGEPHNSCPGEIFPACWSDGNISGCSGAAVRQRSSPHAPKKRCSCGTTNSVAIRCASIFFFFTSGAHKLPVFVTTPQLCYCYLRQELVLHPKRAVTRTTPPCNYDTQPHSTARQKHGKCSAGSNVVGVFLLNPTINVPQEAPDFTAAEIPDSSETLQQPNRSSQEPN